MVVLGWFSIAPLASADVSSQLPTNYSVASGSATFTNDGTHLNITASNRAIINYGTFNIGQANSVHIQSPLSLHRVTGGTPSQIFGKLTSSGRVFLINPSGVFFGPNANVNVQGLVASTLDIRNQDFLADQFKFIQSNNHAPAAITNQGDITATQDIAMLASAISNEGTLTAPSVALAVGKQITYKLGPDLLADVTIDQALETEVANTQAAIKNSGLITAEKAQLQARLIRSFYNATINNTGIVRAKSFHRGTDGKILALGTTDDRTGKVINSGTLTASNETGNGGAINLLGDEVTLAAGSTVDVSGTNGGGTALIGGDYQGQNPSIFNALNTWAQAGSSILANATSSGTGGKVILWANNNTASHGTIQAKGINGGGFVETSGKHYLDVQSLPDVSTLFGPAGTWLLDPNDLTIGAGSTQTNINGASPFLTTNNTSVLGVNLINSALALGNVTISTGTGGTNSENGDITVSSALAYTGVAGRTLTFNAHRNLNVNAAISSTNALNMVFNADTDANTTGNFVNNASGTITSGGGTVAINARDITLGGTINSGNANTTLTAGNTITATRPVLTGTGVVNVTAPTSTSFNYNVASSPMRFGTINSPIFSAIANGTSSTLTLNNGYSGTNLTLQAQGTSGAITSSSNIATTGLMDIRSFLSNVTVNGNVSNTGTTGVNYLAAGSGTFSATTDLNVTGTVAISGGATKTLSVFDGNGSIFTKPLFTDGTARAFNTLDFRRGDASGVFNYPLLTGFALPSANLTLRTLGTNGVITLPAFSGTNLTLNTVGNTSNINTAGITATDVSLQAQGTSSAITTTGNIASSGVMDIRSYLSNVTVTGNVSNTGTTGTNFLAAGSGTFSATTNLGVTGTLGISGGAGKILTIWDGNGDIFTKPMFTDGTARAFNTLNFRRADASGTFNYPTFTGFANPTNLTLTTLGTNGVITLPSFTGTSVALNTQGATSNINTAGITATGVSLIAQGTSSAIATTGNIASSGVMDIRSYLSNVTITGNLSNTGTTGTNYLAAGSGTFGATTNLGVTGTLAITGGAGKILNIYDGNGDIFTKPMFTDAGARPFSQLFLRRGDANGVFNMPTLTGFGNPTNTLSLITLGTNGHITIPSFTGTTLTLNTQGTGANITSNGNVSVSGVMDIRSYLSNVTITGNLSNTGTTGVNYLAAGSNGFTATTNLGVTGTVAITGAAAKSLYIYDGNGDIFSKPMFTTGPARASTLLDFRRGDASGSFNFPTMTGFANPSGTLSLITLGSGGNVTTNGFTGTSLVLNSQGSSGDVTVNGNVSTSTGVLDLRSWNGNVNVTGNVGSTATNGTHYLAAGWSTFNNTKNLTVGGTFTFTNNASKAFYAYDGNGDFFSKPYFSSAMALSTASFRSAANTNFGSVATPWNGDFGTLELQTLGNAYLTDTTTTLNARTLGTGVGGTLQLRGVGNQATSNTITAGVLDWATSTNGNIALNYNTIGTNGVTLSANGTGVINVANLVTLSSTNSPINLTSLTATLNTTGALNAGTGTITLRSNTAQAHNVGITTKDATYDISSSELGRMTAGTVSVGDAAQNNAVTINNPLNLSGSGAGRYNLTLNTAGAITTGANALTLGDKDLNFTAGGNLNTAIITGTAGSNVSLSSGNLLTLGGALSADILSLSATGASGNIAINNATTAITSSTLNAANASTITQSAVLNSPTLTLNTGSGDATLGNVSNAFLNVTANRTGTGTTTIVESNGMTLNASNHGNGTLNISTVTGDINVAGATTVDQGTLVANGNLVLNSGSSITANGTGNALTLAAITGDFTNNAVGTPLNTPSGRWLIYSGSPANTTEGALSYTKRYNRTYAGNPPGGIVESGNVINYRLAPTITVTTNGATREYGDANPTFSAL